MSRIGKQPIEIPNGVTVALEGKILKISGPKGNLSVELPPKVSAEIKEREVSFSVQNPGDSRQAAFWGLARSLAANAVFGVLNGYEKKLEISGVGYKVQEKGGNLVLFVGFSHPVEFKAPEGVMLKAEGNTITVSGIDKCLVGEAAARIRKIKKPEPYKGKGIKYSDEVVRRKAGKVVKGAEG